MDNLFKALIVKENNDGSFSRAIEDNKISDLPDNGVLIRVKYSALNYKDGLSASGHKGITRNYPHTPGVDAGGVVMESKSEKFVKGDEVVVTGHDLGMNTNGGFGQYINVPADWIIKLANNLTLREAMIYGTAGITAAMCVYELEKHHITPDKGKIIVTGATGGVGSMAVAILSKAGYDVIASTGKMNQIKFLQSIGAKEIIHRSEVIDKSGRPLLKSRWIGAIDTVGGKTLSTVISHTAQHGTVCCLGLVESDKLETSLYPFILRGITLIGIDSAERGLQLKRYLWNQLALQWKPDNLELMAKEVKLVDIEEEIDKILDGGQVGKVLIDCK